MTVKGNQYGPTLVGVGAAAVDFQVGTGRMPMAQPGAQAARKKPVYNDQEIEALGAYVASLGPGPAVPDVDPAGHRRRRPGRGRGVLPHQLHRVPQLRRQRRRPAGRQVRTEPPRRLAQAHLRGHAHRAAADAGLLRQRAHPRGQAGHHRLPEEEREPPRATAGSPSARSARSPRACSPGWSASAALVLIGIWITAKNTRSTKTKKAERMSSDAARSATGSRPPRSPSRSPNPGLPEHLPRPTDVDPAAEKRAERQVATLFGLSACSPCSSASPTSSSIGETRRVPRHGRLQRRPRRHPRPGAALHRRRR